MIEPDMRVEDGIMKLEVGNDFVGGIATVLAIVSLELVRATKRGEFTKEYAEDLFDRIGNETKQRVDALVEID